MDCAGQGLSLIHISAKLIQHEVSDGIIAPGYDADALEVLKSKKKGNYNIVAIDPDVYKRQAHHHQAL